MRILTLAFFSYLLIGHIAMAADDQYSEITGIWDFDPLATRTHILSLPNWTREMTDHVMSAYGTHEYTFSGKTYSLKYKDKTINGTIEIGAIRGGTLRVRFTCPNHQDDEVGTIQVTNDTMIYKSHTPMFKGEALYYKRRRSYSRSGDAPSRPPWPSQNFSQRHPFLFYRQALS